MTAVILASVPHLNGTHLVTLGLDNLTRATVLVSSDMLGHPALSEAYDILAAGGATYGAIPRRSARAARQQRS
jgi:hypothetical protein